MKKNQIKEKREEKVKRDWYDKKLLESLKVEGTKRGSVFGVRCSPKFAASRTERNQKLNFANSVNYYVYNILSSSTILGSSARSGFLRVICT